MLIRNGRRKRDRGRRRQSAGTKSSSNSSSSSNSNLAQQRPALPTEQQAAVPTAHLAGLWTLVSGLADWPLGADLEQQEP